MLNFRGRSHARSTTESSIFSFESDTTSSASQSPPASPSTTSSASQSPPASPSDTRTATSTPEIHRRGVEPQTGREPPAARDEPMPSVEVKDEATPVILPLLPTPVIPLPLRMIDEEAAARHRTPAVSFSVSSTPTTPAGGFPTPPGSSTPDHTPGPSFAEPRTRGPKNTTPSGHLTSCLNGLHLATPPDHRRTHLRGASEGGGGRAAVSYHFGPLPPAASSSRAPDLVTVNGPRSASPSSSAGSSASDLSFSASPTSSARMLPGARVDSPSYALSHGACTPPAPRTLRPVTPDRPRRPSLVPGSGASRRSPAPQPAYNPDEEEERSEESIGGVAIDRAVAGARASMDRLAGVLGRGGGIGHDGQPQVDGAVMLRLREQAQALAAFSPQSAYIVGIVGDSGGGKSSVLNALLHHEGLTRTDSANAAVTCMAIEFWHHDRDDFVLEVQPFALAELQEQVANHLHAYREYHQGAPTMPKPDEGSDGWEAALANDTFQALFGRQLARDGGDAKLREEPIEAVLPRLHGWLAGLYATLPTARETFANVDRFKARLHALTSHASGRNRDAHAPALWPCIRSVKVSLRARILSQGLVLVDLPGLRDRNVARQEVALRYMRKCNRIFAVCSIGRAVTDMGVKEVLDKARKLQIARVGIICTKTDVLNREEAKAGLTGELRRTAERLTESIVDAKDELDDLEWQGNVLLEQEMEGADRPREGNASFDVLRRQQQLRIECRSLEQELDTLLVQDRNDRTKRDLDAQYRRELPEDGRLLTFCVSNKYYWDYANRPKEETRPVLHLSGIPELRKHCLSMAADGRFQQVKKYFRNEISALLGEVKMWAASGVESRDANQKQVILKTLETAESDLAKGLIGSEASFKDIAETMTAEFENEVYKLQRPTQWAQDALEAAKTWSGLHYSVHERKQNGEDIKQDWNEEIIETMVADLQAPWAVFCAVVSAEHDRVVRGLEAVLTSTLRSIDPIRNELSGSAVTLHQTLRARNHDLLDAVKTIQLDFDDKVRHLRAEALTGMKFSLIRQAMKGSYSDAMRVNGTGSYRRVREIIEGAVQSPRLFQELMIIFWQRFRQHADELGESLQTAAATHLRAVHDTFDMVRSENVVRESQQDPEFRQRVADEVIAAQEDIESCQNMLRLVGSTRRLRR
ncbi:Dynamin, GTPase domain protein [Niveomyces insectorum RCEF 264]|uniref:Dynamin, GTPase domain protein n=1 Tax=Niveomyces insectorum RCEF 264 TaxID=1081102 RepID=A0A167TAB2_9HYPO|nr:Dynamin, GTPase domain protein [Niveomyces insectorum RCEF 264]